ncbi:hypothetical protein BaRGS_00006535, partial [Batillaria attramentaria]
DTAMSMVILGEQGCILDHNAAVARVYRWCHPQHCALITTPDKGHGRLSADNAQASNAEKVDKDGCHAKPLQSLGERTEAKSQPAVCMDNCNDTMKPRGWHGVSSSPVLNKSLVNSDSIRDTSESVIVQHTTSLPTKPESLTSGSVVLLNKKNDREDSNPRTAEGFIATTSEIQSDNVGQSTSTFQLKKGFFSVYVPFMMDSQFEKVQKTLTEESLSSADHPKDGTVTVADVQQILVDKRKKRKRKPAVNNTEDQDKERRRLTQVHASLVKVARQQGIFQEHLPTPLDNNLLYRQCAQYDLADDCFHNLLVTKDGLPVEIDTPQHDQGNSGPLIIDSSDSGTHSAQDFIHRRVEHGCDEPSVVSISGEMYDLIVLDPPWENKSVKRKKSYDMVGETALQQLPIPKLARPGSLVALWVTNNDRLEEFAMEELFPAWRLHPVAKWHWLKVTQTGDMVTSLSEGHKRPFEVLLLGRVDSQQDSEQSRQKNASSGAAVKDPPQSLVIISVPCSLHSKKVPLSEVLSPYLPENPRCLELFARNLWPGWTSWGRE